MKECLICGEMLDDHAIKCSKGHSRFKVARGKHAFLGDRQIVENMLRSSSVNYTEAELAHLADEITKIMRDARAPITESMVDKIRENIEKKHQQRLEAERQRQAETKRREDEGRAEIERRRYEKEQLLNTDIERVLSVFRGFNDRPIHQRDLIQLLADTLNASLYNRLQYPPNTLDVVDSTYKNNQIFWNDALNKKLIQGMRIGLHEFHLMEWIPSAPGRYFTDEARRARESAKEYISSKQQEYLPLGKEAMILGGIGSIRLGARPIGRDEAYPLCASSTGISHQGIPVILPERKYRQIMHLLRKSGGCLTNIIGYLKIIPATQLPINYDTQIPRYFLFAEDIEIVGASEQLLATVAVTFSDSDRIDSKLWSFCSFDPTQQDVGKAVSWLKDYTLRYSSNPHPFILGDFDEHYQHFENQVEFPLYKVLGGWIDYSKLSQYKQALHFTINIGEYIMGDKQDFSGAIITNIGGQQLVGKFNETIANLNTNGQQEFGQALAELTKAVAASSHLSEQEKREKLDMVLKLGEEAAKPQPNKSFLKILGDALIGVLKTVPDVAQAVAALAPLLTRMTT